jgi:1,4-dihydroxy-2-naphthoate octaprenyltransferase
LSSAPPQSKRALLSKATRAKTLPVMLSPVVVGSALAWNRGSNFAWGWFAVTVVGAAALHLGANVLNDYYDERSGADKLARLDRTAVATGSGLIESGVMSARAMLGLAAACFGVALACGLALSVARGWTVFALGAAGAFLAWQYVAPPIKYGYRGRGLGEAGIFCAFGLLPVAGSYYVQAQRLDAAAFWASIVPGMLTTLVLYHHHFLHWRSDKAAGKMTPVAALGPEAAVYVSGVAITITYMVLVAETGAHLFPWGALAALPTVLPLAAAWRKQAADPVAQHALGLLGATLAASVFTGLILTVSLVVARALR